jgi:hypothetical protein
MGAPPGMAAPPPGLGPLFQNYGSATSPPPPPPPGEAPPPPVSLPGSIARTPLTCLSPRPIFPHPHPLPRELRLVMFKA